MRRLAFLLLPAAGCSDELVPLPELPPALDIAARVTTIHSHGCARMLDNRLACWSEVVLGCRPEERRPAQLVASEVRGVSMGWRSTCAAFDGGVKCWGEGNEFGVLGQGDTLARGSLASPAPPIDEIPFVDLGTDVPVRAVVPDTMACVLFEDGRMKCWGGSEAGVPGVSTEPLGDEPGEMGAALPYVDLGTGARVVNFDLSGTTACAVLADGRLKCWGDNNDQGRLGLGDTRDRGYVPGEMGDALPAVDLGSDTRVIDVAVGSAHACAVLEGGGVKCWGRNHDVFEPDPHEVRPPEIRDSGRLGYEDLRHRGATPEDMGDNLPFVDLGRGARAVAVDAGLGHSCAVLETGKLKCWGIGRGDEPGEMGDALPAYDFGSGRVIGYASKYESWCAMLDSGEPRCWGVSAQLECPPILPE